MIIEKEKGCLVEVKVKPNQNAFKIYERNGRVIIEVKSKAEHGRANEELCRKLEKLFKNKVIIIKGKKLSRKTLFIENITQDEFHRLLRDHDY